MSDDDRPEVRCARQHLQTPHTSRAVVRPDGTSFRRCLLCTAANQSRYDATRRLFKRLDEDSPQQDSEPTHKLIG